MDHSNHASMGTMSMGGAAPLFDYPKFYWAVVGGVIGVASLVNVFNYVMYRQRLSAAKAGSLQPAKPKTWPLIAIAITFAITRELSHYSMRLSRKNRMLRLPTLGRASLILANVIVLLVLGLSGLDLKNLFEREDVGYRLGFVSIAQLPLFFLLAGRNNIIGYLTGVSHDRLTWLHRWCARCLLLTATLHMGYFFSAWAPYDYIRVQLKEDTLVWKGLVAWAMLVWIVFSSFGPIRGWCYEFFVVQHLVSFAILIGFIYIHTPEEVHAYICWPVGIFIFDRVLRIARLLYANVSFFHSKQRKDGRSGFWTCKAEFTPLPHNTTRVVIQNPPISWTPGQHVFLSCQPIVPLQSHPFTIASVPEDGKMEFFIKAETGGTRQFFKHAEETHRLPAPGDRSCVTTVAIEGGYGCLRPLRQFDSFVLLAGSTGATFAVPLLRDIVHGWKENAAPAKDPNSLFGAPTGAVTRHVRFVWVVKSRGQLGWFAEQLSSVYTDFQKLQEHAKHIQLELTVYVTCDEAFTEEHRTLLCAMTTPNPDAITATQKSLELRHGSVQYRSPSLSEDEKTKANEINQDVKEVRSNSISSPPCDCKATVDESSPDAIQIACCCNDSSPPLSQFISRIASSSNTQQQQHPKPLVHPSIYIFSGHPKPRDIIRRSLEQALGESAVVVCGPRGMVADVKRDVCALSDERAVHKGMGAQGVYLHTECFGW